MFFGELLLAIFISRLRRALALVWLIMFVLEMFRRSILK